MFTNILTPLITRPDAILSLVRLREAWELEAEGTSLVYMKGSVGLLLLDFVNAAGLTLEDKAQILGSQLMIDLAEALG